MYLTIVDNYKAGDSIYIIGYSRGAAAAQELAFMLDNLGIPRSSSYAREAAKKVFPRMCLMSVSGLGYPPFYPPHGESRK